MHRVFIIAEAGVNHNGSVEIAKKLIDAASEAGADAVKFQTFRAENTVTRFGPKAEYQKEYAEGNGSQLEMLKRLELDREAHKGLIDYSSKRGILFLSSPFDLESIDLLASLGLQILKIPSGQIIDLPYLRKIGTLKKSLIMSTGMATLEEIKEALDILTGAGTPKENITVLHCNTEYPTPVEDVNLLAMITIKKGFDIKVGYSDHTRGIEIPIAAAALGASVIEKHFTLDRTMEGPDHKASIEPHELRAMVSAIRNVEKSLGDGIKRPSPSELKNKATVRKSIVAAKFIKKGEKFRPDNVTTKRPATGINPMEWDRVVGSVAKRDFRADELIEI